MKKRKTASASLAQPPMADLSVFIADLPKVELHAHLSGSVSWATLASLAPSLGDTPPKKPDCTADCFEYFAGLAKVITSLESLRFCTLAVLQDFAAENCVYLELRSTPKQFRRGPGSEELTAKHEYVETVVAAVKEFEASSRMKGASEPMCVRLLLSLDRGKLTTEEKAYDAIKETVELCTKYDDHVVGIDVCGDPAVRSLCTGLLPAMERYFVAEGSEEKRAFLKRFPLTVHTAEEPDEPSAEGSGERPESRRIVDLMEALNIRRLGHVTYLSGEDRGRVQAIAAARSAREGEGEAASATCVELCPTSNVVTSSMGSLTEHHFPQWRKTPTAEDPTGDVTSPGPPCAVAICTDDTGLFQCNLRSELALLATTFHVSAQELVELQRQAIRASFCREETLRGAVLKRLDAFEKVATAGGC